MIKWKMWIICCLLKANMMPIYEWCIGSKGVSGNSQVSAKASLSSLVLIKAASSFSI